jgi:hypothetical protein
LLSGPWKLLHKQLLISRFVVTVESISRAAVPGPPGRLPSRPAPLRQYMAENDHTLYGVMQSQALGAMPGAFSLNGGHVSSSGPSLSLSNFFSVILTIIDISMSQIKCCSYQM